MSKELELKIKALEKEVETLKSTLSIQELQYKLSFEDVDKKLKELQEKCSFLDSDFHKRSLPQTWKKVNGQWVSTLDNKRD